MSRQATKVGTAIMVLLVVLTPLAQAEITSIAGYTRVEVTEYVDGLEGDSDWAMDEYPGTAAELPLQVVARLIGSEYLAGVPEEEAAAAVAAQFADPRDLDQANPEEFAINLALSSVSESIRYEAEAISRETRGVLYSAGELYWLPTEGDTGNVTGRLFLDGALVLLAVDPAKDLTGASVTLYVTVVQSTDGQSDQTVFSGEVSLVGAAGGDATVEAEGSFPTASLLRVDLGALLEDFGAVQVLVIPNITIDYTYPVIIGQPFTLQASVEVEAANVVGECGVAAVIGTPVETLTQVIGATQGSAVASKTVTALTNERENPTGEAAFPQRPTFFPACGLLGFESLIGVAGLVGLKRFAGPRVRRRR